MKREMLNNPVPTVTPDDGQRDEDQQRNEGGIRTRVRNCIRNYISRFLLLFGLPERRQGEHVPRDLGLSVSEGQGQSVLDRDGYQLVEGRRRQTSGLSYTLPSLPQTVGPDKSREFQFIGLSMKMMNENEMLERYEDAIRKITPKKYVETWLEVFKPDEAIRKPKPDKLPYIEALTILTNMLVGKRKRDELSDKQWGKLVRLAEEIWKARERVYKKKKKRGSVAEKAAIIGGTSLPTRFVSLNAGNLGSRESVSETASDTASETASETEREDGHLTVLEQWKKMHYCMQKEILFVCET